MKYLIVCNNFMIADYHNLLTKSAFIIKKPNKYMKAKKTKYKNST